MNTSMHDKRFTALTAGGLVTGVAALIIGVLFASEGLLGYYYNYSMFFEGLSHMWEIFGGLAVAVAGVVVAAVAIVRR